MPGIIRGKDVTSRPRRTQGSRVPALQLPTPPLLTSSSLKVEYVLMYLALSERTSDGQEHLGHGEATVFYWSRQDWNSLSVLTLGRILCVVKVKNFFLWSHDSKDKLPITQQHMSLLQNSVYAYSETSICPCSLSFHPVYPLGSWPCRVSSPRLSASLPRIRKQTVSHWYPKTFIWPKSPGWGQVQLT